MRKVTVKLGKRSYDIIIGKRIIGKFPLSLRGLNIGRDAYIITNSLIKGKYGKELSGLLHRGGFNFRFKTVSDSERSKSLEKAGEVIRDLARFDRKRKVFIIAFGGGVIGDLSGFVASVYKRGIAYVQLPTTLLAQVDSSIGGKTAVDLALGKNLVGAFYQPALVFSEIGFLKSLDIRQISSGMAEVIKYALIKDAALFGYLKAKRKDILSAKPQALEKIVGACSAIKARIAGKDERELLGLRTILNFGHTFAHAIESACGYKSYNHGEAVALGMIAASDLSRRLGFIGEKAVLDIEELIVSYGLPSRLKGLSMDRIIEAYYHDKKFSGKRNKLVLLRGISRPVVVSDIALDQVKKSLARIISRGKNG